MSFEEAGEGHASGGSLLPMAAADPPEKQRCADSGGDPVPIKVAATFHTEDTDVGVLSDDIDCTTGLGYVREGDDGGAASSVWLASAGVDYGKHSPGSALLCLDDGYHSKTGGSVSSAVRPTSDCGLSKVEEDNWDCSSSSTLLYHYDGHDSDTGTDSPAVAECTHSPVTCADKAVQCDMFSPEWAEQIHREVMERIEDLKRRIRLYDALLE